MKRWLLLGLLFLATAAWGQADPNANNTSACAANGSPAYCNKAFTALSANPAHTNAQTQVVDAAPSNVSGKVISSRLYPGATSRIYMHYQPWFCNTGTTCNNHINIGYDENNSATVTGQLTDMHNRGVQAVVIDYYGDHAAKAFNLATVDAIATVIAGNQAAYPKLMLSLDQGSWTNSGQCPAGSGITDAQMEACIEGRLDYMAVHYLYQSYYETTGGKPVVTLFLDETNWSGVDFNNVWPHVHAHVAAGQSCGSGCTYTTQVLLVSRNSGSITRTGLDGGFAWPPAVFFDNTIPSTQFLWNGAAGYLDNFYSICRANPTKICIGLMETGFNDFNASFGTGKVMAQQCAQVPKLSADKIAAAGYSVSSQLFAVQVATWNDYEEGTEIETGLDNCYTVSASLVGTTVSWTLNKTDVTYADPSTIDSVQVLYSDGTSTPQPLVSGLAVSNGSTNIAGLLPLGTWKIWVGATGQSLVKNKFSASLDYANGRTTTRSGNYRFSGAIKISP